MKDGPMKKIPTVYTKIYFNLVCLSRKLLKFVIFLFTTIFSFSLLLHDTLLSGYIAPRDLLMLTLPRIQLTSPLQFIWEIFFIYFQNYIMIISITGLVLLFSMLIRLFKLFLLVINSKLHLVTQRTDKSEKGVTELISEYLSETFEKAKILSLKAFNFLLGFNFFIAVLFILFSPFFMLQNVPALPSIALRFFNIFHITHPFIVYFVLVILYFKSKGLYIKYFHSVFGYYLANYFDEATRDSRIQDYFMKNYYPFFKSPITITTTELRGGDGYRNERYERKVVEMFRNKISSFLIGGSEEVLVVYQIEESNSWIPYKVPFVKKTYRGLLYDAMQDNFKGIKTDNLW